MFFFYIITISLYVFKKSIYLIKNKISVAVLKSYISIFFFIFILCFPTLPEPFICFDQIFYFFSFDSEARLRYSFPSCFLKNIRDPPLYFFFSFLRSSILSAFIAGSIFRCSFLALYSLIVSGCGPTFLIE